MSTAELETTAHEDLDLGPEVASELAAVMESELNEANLLVDDDDEEGDDDDDGGGAAAPVAETPAPALINTQGSSSTSAPSSDAAKTIAATAAVVTAPTVTPPPLAAGARSTSSSGKSKKKKSGGCNSNSENTGRWTAEEHRLFLQGLELHGKGWKKIAGLIKTRTVVQIRTHAQKYFQKLAKARQNGEDGDVAMEGRNGVASIASASTTAAAPANKRRRPSTGTKRKAIQSVVSSAIRQGKKMAIEAVTPENPNPTPPLPAIAPALAHFVLPPKTEKGEGTTSISTLQGTISGSVLEDSLFRFLTPAPVESAVNNVARQAGANPISLPTENTSSAPAAAGGGEISPTGVNELSLYPSWVDAKDMPAWYAKGADVDALLDVADTLDWLADPGDLNEHYQDDEADVEVGPDLKADSDDSEQQTDAKVKVEYPIHDAVQPQLSIQQNIHQFMPEHSASANSLPRVASNVESVVPPLPSIFDKAPSAGDLHIKQEALNAVMPSSNNLQEHDDLDNDDLEVFESAMEEHDFVSTILEEHADDTLVLQDSQHNHED